MKNDGSKVIEVNSAKHSVLIDSSRNIYVYDRASKEDVESYVLSENTKSFLDCRIALTIISTLLLIYVSFSWIMSNMKIKEVLLKIRASV